MAPAFLPAAATVAATVAAATVAATVAATTAQIEQMNQQVITQTIASGAAPYKVTGNFNQFVVNYCSVPVQIRLNGSGDFTTYKIGDAENTEGFHLLEIQSASGGAVTFTLFVTDQNLSVTQKAEVSASFITTTSITVPSHTAPPAFSCLGYKTFGGVRYRRKSLIIQNNDGTAVVWFLGQGDNTGSVAANWFIGPNTSTQTIETDSTFSLFNSTLSTSNVTLVELWYYA